MTKAFGLVKTGDDVYLVCKDRETNLFKIRTVKVTEAAYLEDANSIHIKCGILEFTADANRTYAYHKHVNTFIKGFTIQSLVEKEHLDIFFGLVTKERS